MKTLNALTLLVVLAIGSPFAHARRAKQQADNFDVGKYLSEAGIDYDQKQLDTCLKERDPGRGTLGQKPRFLGVTLRSFARSVCRSGSDPAKVAMLNGAGGGQDAVGNTLVASSAGSTRLASLGSDISSPSMLTNEGSSLTNTYELLLGLAARESTWNFAEGPDRSARHSSSSTVEAGAFQTSYNIHGCLKGKAREGLVKLEKSYSGASGEDCMSSNGSVRISDASEGSAAFQSALRNCPALAVEHAAITVRQCKAHYGPLKRGEAKKFKGCRPLLESIAVQATTNPSVCQTVSQSGRTPSAQQPVVPASLSTSSSSGGYDNLFKIGPGAVR